MESWNISTKLRNELLKKSSNIEDNSRRILFILRNLGPQRFTNLIRYSNLSRSTVSKYLNNHRKQNNVEHRLITDKQTNKQYRGYVITEKGIEKLGEEPLKLKDELFVVNELKENVRKLENLIGFYKEINVEDHFIVHIVRIISKIGDNFFELQQDRDLHLSLFYIFYNSILGQGAFARNYWHFDESSTEDFVGYKLNLDRFCEVYQVSKEAINYLARSKLIKNSFGFYLIKRENNDFFFHEEDLVGTTTLRLIKDKLIDEIINLQEGIYDIIYDLDIMAEEITEQLKEMGLIWDAIQGQFQLLVLNLIIKSAIEMGFLDIERKKFMEGITQSNKIFMSQEGKMLQTAILEGSNININLNFLSIPLIPNENKIKKRVSRSKNKKLKENNMIISEEITKEIRKIKSELNKLSDLGKLMDSEARKAPVTKIINYFHKGSPTVLNFIVREEIPQLLNEIELREAFEKYQYFDTDFNKTGIRIVVDFIKDHDIVVQKDYIKVLKSLGSEDAAREVLKALNSIDELYVYKNVIPYIGIYDGNFEELTEILINLLFRASEHIKREDCDGNLHLIRPHYIHLILEEYNDMFNKIIPEAKFEDIEEVLENFRIFFKFVLLLDDIFVSGVYMDEQGKFYEYFRHIDGSLDRILGGIEVNIMSGYLSLKFDSLHALIEEEIEEKIQKFNKSRFRFKKITSDTLKFNKSRFSFQIETKKNE